MKNQPAPAAQTPVRKPAGKLKLLEDKTELLAKQLADERAAHDQTRTTLKARNAAYNEQADLRSAAEGRLAKTMAALKPFYEATKTFGDDKPPRWPDGGAVVLFGKITAGDVRAARDAWLAAQA